MSDIALMSTRHPVVRPLTLPLAGGMLLALAACDEAVTMMSTGIDTLGQPFVNAFNADPNATPIEPDTANLTVNLTAEPFNP